jgi:hypothetical protein
MKYSTVTYCGEIADDGYGSVYSVKKPLNPRHDLRNHSQTFAWGYGGSGPAQLALAILADFLENDEMALKLYQKFKFHVIAGLDSNSGFTITGGQIMDFMKLMEVRDVIES